jgi:hypothetical protein
MEIASYSDHWGIGHYKNNTYNPGNGTHNQNQMHYLHGLELNGLAKTNKDWDPTNTLKTELG